MNSLSWSLLLKVLGRSFTGVTSYVCGGSGVGFLIFIVFCVGGVCFSAGGTEKINQPGVSTETLCCCCLPTLQEAAV